MSGPGHSRNWTAAWEEKKENLTKTLACPSTMQKSFCNGITFFFSPTDRKRLADNTNGTLPTLSDSKHRHILPSICTDILTSLSNFPYVIPTSPGR